MLKTQRDLGEGGLDLMRAKECLAECCERELVLVSLARQPASDDAPTIALLLWLSRGSTERLKEGKSEFACVGTCSDLTWFDDLRPPSLLACPRVHLRDLTRPAAGSSLAVIDSWPGSVLGHFAPSRISSLSPPVGKTPLIPPNVHQHPSTALPSTAIDPSFPRRSSAQHSGRSVRSTSPSPVPLPV